MAIGDSTRINTNIAAFNALHSLKFINRNLEISQLKLATGLRINEVADDPAGFVISRRLGARSRGLSVAYDNVGTAKNVLAIAEGGLLNISDILITIKEKVTSAASDTLGSAERNAIKTEIDQLTSEIDDIVEETTFNNISLIDGTYSVSYQTGEGTTNTLHFAITQSASSSSLQVDSSNVSSKVFTATGASAALAKVNTAIETVSDMLQNIGASVSRLTVKEATLSIAITNTDATKSRILDADIAMEQLKSTRLQILQQTATAQLAQANVVPQNVLALFR
ncbi:flagellin [candidate division KSB1 bacterium]|nr:MAG: flagellin [candidate division KSB1 bacterium]